MLRIIFVLEIFHESSQTVKPKCCLKTLNPSLKGTKRADLKHLKILLALTIL